MNNVTPESHLAFYNFGKVRKTELFAAFEQGRAITLKGLSFRVINSIEREDGSNQSYNVTGITELGRKVTIHVYTA